MTKYEKSIKIYGDDVGCVDYVDHMGSDLTIVNSARVSFGVQKHNLDGRDKRLINYLIKHKHTSTLEHNLVTFKFTVPLYIRSQHHRHRTWSYNEISRRYTDKKMRFYEPRSFRTQHETNTQASNPDELINPDMSYNMTNCLYPPTPHYASDAVFNHHQASLELFNRLIEQGVCREQARGVLPQNLYTEYYGTVNLNNLLKFVSLRIHEGAQWEIQRVAEAVLEIATDLWPVAVESYRKQRGGI